MGRRKRLHRVPQRHISIHPSRVGWDLELLRLRSQNIYFNPPIPCGMGRIVFDDAPCRVEISIHPSRVGWDQQRSARPSRVRNFNPPIPCGMGQQAGIRRFGRDSFQSTHPVWDGTCEHGTLHGMIFNFNPPIPCGMGPSERSFSKPFVFLFQSTHPVWDGTPPQLFYFFAAKISIHPSRVGWDDTDIPRGSRPSEFQSTHPVWDGTPRSMMPRETGIFQSTHPVWDGTQQHCSRCDQRRNFNPPIPCGMGRITDGERPRDGAFQSTHPVWDGTSAPSTKRTQR